MERETIVLLNKKVSEVYKFLLALTNLEEYKISEIKNITERAEQLRLKTDNILNFLEGTDDLK